MAAQFYREEDGDVAVLRRKKLAIIGYGNLGRPFALNLRDSGVPLIVGNVEDIYADRARADGFEVVPIMQAAQSAGVLLVLVSDEVMPRVYLEMIAPGLGRGDTLIFAAAYNVVFGFIEPPTFVDVGMVAPRMVGAGVRERYLSGEGFISFVGVERNTSGTAWETVLAVAKGAGSLKAGALGLTFEQETELDLFVQQGFMSILYGLLNTVGALLVEKGYPPEAVATELYLSGELAYIFEKAAEVGLIEQAQVHSLTNQYGLLSRYERVGEPKLQRQLTAILDQIRSGAFAQDWASEYLNGYPNLRDYLETLADWPIAGLEARAFRMLAGRSGSAPDDEDTQRRR